MGIDTWVTIVAYDTPFLAQMVTDRLDEVGIASRTLSDSAGGNLPHISFGSGGYRVQVSREDEGAARDAIESLPDDFMDDVDVGKFEDGPDGVVPDPTTPDDAHGVDHRHDWIQLVAIAVILTVLAGFLLGPSALLPWILRPFGG